MTKIKYVEANGIEHELHVENGQSVMQGAVENMLDGILAECGGSCSCATCHCYVDDAWMEKLDTPDKFEKELIECVPNPRPNSRLSCQIKVMDELDGLVIHLPESQY